MTVSIIAAVADNLVIGHKNQMPWHLPADLKHFKELTLGSAVVMGRKTHESIGRALPGRLNVVISRNAEYSSDGITLAASLEEAIAAAKDSGAKQCFLIGGGHIYREALDKKLVELIYITRIHHTFNGDVFFPALATSQWEKVADRPYSADTQNAHNFSFETWIPAHVHA